jgi:hypothetical protein
MHIIRLGVALAALIPASALAQTETAPTPQVLTDVYSCAQVQDDAQRLQCYDGAVGRLRQAETQGQVVAVDRAQAADIERDSFGFHLPSLGRLLPNLEGGDRVIDNVEMTVAVVRRSPTGYHTFQMENGQIWTQVEPDSARNVRAGDVITIERASLGSFRLSSSRGGAAHRVRRTN